MKVGSPGPVPSAATRLWLLSLAGIGPGDGSIVLPRFGVPRLRWGLRPTDTPGAAAGWRLLLMTAWFVSEETIVRTVWS